MKRLRGSEAPLWRCTLIAAVLLALPGCVAWQFNDIAAQLPSLGASSALASLEKVQAPQRDRAQYLLNRGTLKFYIGDLAGSRADLSAAKDIMSALQATSMSESLAALSVNETLRSYAGTPTDQVMVHVLLALTYLCDDDLDGARVEILQSQVMMQRLAKADSSRGQLVAAHVVAGVIYELNREWDDALISYRHAYQVLTQRRQTIPISVQDSLLRLTQRQGLSDELAKFEKQFSRQLAARDADSGDLILFYLEGVVSSRHAERIAVVAGEESQLVTVAVPAYYDSRHYPDTLSLQIDAKSHQSRVIEDFEARAREDLDAEQAQILAAATVRAVAKYQMVKAAQEKGEMEGLFANLFTVASEQADVRSWNMLPATLQILRAPVPRNSTLQFSRAGLASAQALQPASRGETVVAVLSDLNPGLLLSFPPAPGTRVDRTSTSLTTSETSP